MPMANHTSSLRQVDQGSESIRPNEDRAPIGATNHTQGVLNFRVKPGSRTRNTSTPTDTITKASNVPILQRFPASRTGSTAPKKATTTPVTIVTTHGV